MRPARLAGVPLPPSACVLQHCGVPVPSRRGRAALPVSTQRHLERLHQHAERGEVCHEGLPCLRVLRLPQRGAGTSHRSSGSGGGLWGATCWPGFWVRVQLWSCHGDWWACWAESTGQQFGPKFREQLGLLASRKKPRSVPFPCSVQAPAWECGLPAAESSPAPEAGRSWAAGTCVSVSWRCRQCLPGRAVWHEAVLTPWAG